MASARPTSSPWCALLPLVAALLVAGCDDGRVYFSPPYLAASSDLLDFGSAEVGEKIIRTVHLVNMGGRTARFDQPHGDLLDGVFDVEVSSEWVGPSGDAIIRVTFEPTEAAVYETAIYFPNTSGNQPELMIRLRGRGDVPDPCRRVYCNSPPPRTCVTSMVSRSFHARGVCTDGECEYDYDDEECSEFGCNPTTGYCQGDPCLGVVCQTPPSPCFHTQGSCSGGACTYTVNDGLECSDNDPCTLDDVCDQGVCRGTRKQCNTPPPRVCVAEKTLRRYDAAGDCDASGACQYPHQDIHCEFGCHNGECKGDPCAGGCDDGNPCTINECVFGQGCVTRANDGASCTTTHGDCPQGVCVGTSCMPRSGVACTTRVRYDLCQSVPIAGICTGAGRCNVTEVPPEYRCEGCNGFCLKCYIFQYCIPL